MHRLIPFLLVTFILPTMLTAQWVQLPGPYGGIVQALGETADGKLLAAQYAGSIYISSDDGSSWEIAETASWTESIAFFATAPNGTVFAGVYQNLYRSSDGLSWEPLALQEIPASIAFTADGDVLVGGIGVIHRSSNNGDSWMELPVLQASARMIRLTVTGSGAWLAGAYREGVFRSTDEGATWEDVGTALPNDEVYSLSTVDGGTVFAGLNNTTYFTTDLGETWEQVTGMQGVNVYAVHRLSQDRLGAETSGGFYTSEDDGRSWTHTAGDRIRQYFSAFHVSTTGLLLAGSDGTLLRSTDEGNTWQKSDDGIHVTGISALCCPVDGSYLVGGMECDIRRSTDAGQSWRMTDTVFRSFTTEDIIEGRNEVYAVTYDDQQFKRSTNNGINWTAVPPPSENFYGTTLAATASGLLAATYDGACYFTSDLGLTWVQRDSIRPFSGTVNRVKLLTDHSAPATVYAVTDYGLFRSADEGGSWTRLSLTGTYGDVTGLHQASDSTLYVWSRSTLYRSIDHGDSWNDIYESIDLPYHSLIASNSRSDIFIVNRDGIACYLKRYGRWEQTGFPHKANDITAMAVDQDDFLIIGTTHNGIFRSEGTTLGVPARASLSRSLRIDAVYPQPLRARAAVTLRITLEEAAEITLQVFDILGNMVIEQSSRRISAGSQGFSLNTDGLVPGVYTVRVTAGMERAETRLMILD
ncbi:MAG: T9SS type A sorting domain-containing protein [Bacteroidetes bacterium]|nr:T9SS type A sorting domain-containing protein [Bacteroidota bacterium]